MSKVIRDPDNYLKMSEPFKDVEAANKAISDFWKDFYGLRNKHRIQDAVVVVAVSAMNADGDHGDAQTMFSAGSELRVESLLAFGMGMAKVRREEATIKAIDQGRKCAVGEK